MRRPHPLLYVLYTLAALLTAFAIRTAWTTYADRIDFATFYREGQAWNAGAALYTKPATQYLNTNPPTTTMVVFGPLAHLPFRFSLALWWLLGAASLAASLRIIGRELDLRATQLVTITALLLLTEAAFQLTFLGQVTWILLYPATKAWLNFRRNHQVTCAIWLAPVIAVKPPVALVALLLPWRVWAVSGAAAASVTLLSVAISGPRLWLDWLRASESITWLGALQNTSLWGVAARLQTGGVGTRLLIRDLHPVFLIGVVGVSCVIALRVLRTSGADARFGGAVLGGMAIAPLAWPYYAILGVGAIIARWPLSLWTAGLYALWLPILVLPFPQMVLATMYPAGLLVMLWMVTRQAGSERASGNSTGRPTPLHRAVPVAVLTSTSAPSRD